MKKILNYLSLKKIVLVAFILLIAAIIVSSNLQHKLPLLRSKKPAIETAQVVKKTIIKTVEASGKIKAEKQVDLKFPTSGKLAWVGVKEGEQVKKWQAIASLDKRELQKTLEKELIDFLKTRWDFEQYRDDYEVKGEALDKYPLTDAAKRVLEKSQFNLNRDVLDVEIANVTLELATLVSPIEGIVTHIDTPIAGVNITPATAVFTIASPENLIFGVDIDEVDIGMIKVGQKAQISLDSYPEETFGGEVRRVSFVSKTTRGGGTAFEVEVSLPPNTAEQKFKLGMNGDVTIAIDKKETTLVVPNEAIIENDYVWVWESGKAKKIKIKTGITTETKTEVIEGLSQGQKIVISGFENL